MRSPILLLIKMNAAETSASSAIADWTPLAVVSRSLITAEIDTFMSDVSTTSTNIAIASRIANFGLPVPCSGGPALGSRQQLLGDGDAVDVRPRDVAGDLRAGRPVTAVRARAGASRRAAPPRC